MKAVNLFQSTRLIERFNSINECARHFNVSPGWIRKIIRYREGYFPKSEDMRLAYADPFDGIRGMRPSNEPRKVFIWSVNGEFIRTADSINKAAKLTYTRAGNVSAFLKGKLISVNGFVYSLDYRFPGVRRHRRNNKRVDSLAA